MPIPTMRICPFPSWPYCPHAPMHPMYYPMYCPHVLPPCTYVPYVLPHVLPHVLPPCTAPMRHSLTAVDRILPAPSALQVVCLPLVPCLAALSWPRAAVTAHTVSHGIPCAVLHGIPFAVPINGVWCVMMSYAQSLVLKGGAGPDPEFRTRCVHPSNACPNLPLALAARPRSRALLPALACAWCPPT